MYAETNSVSLHGILRAIAVHLQGSSLRMSGSELHEWQRSTPSLRVQRRSGQADLPRQIILRWPHVTRGNEGLG